MAANRVIATAGIIAVAVGSVNAIAKNHKLPSTKFLIGSGVAFLILSAMADVDAELAQALAIAVCTTVVLGEGGGVLSYINNGEIDTKKKTTTGYTGTPEQPPTQTSAPNGNRPPIMAPGLAARPNLG